MKKPLLFSLLVTGFIIAFIGIQNPHAAGSMTSSLTSSKSKINANESFTITIVASGLDAKGLAAADYTVGFDDTKFTYVSSTCGQGSPAGDCMVNQVGSSLKISIMDSDNGLTPFTNGTIVVLNFTAKSTIAPGTANFTLSGSDYVDSDVRSIVGTCNGTSITIPSTNSNLANISLSTGTLSPSFNSATTSYTVSNINAGSITITATKADSKSSITGDGTKTLNYGNNVFNIVVTAESGATKTYVVNVNRVDNRSNDSKLKSLTVSAGAISFNEAITTYNFSVPSNTTTFNALGIANNSNASITYNPGNNINLSTGVNVLNIVVTAENGSKTTYKLNITRPDNRSSNNNLKSLQITNTNINFNNMTSYTTIVENNINTIDIIAVAEDSKATLSGTGTKSLKVGNNAFSVTVKAENEAVKVYTINIIRKDASGNVAKLSEINNLSSLIVEGHNFDFESEILQYKLVVANSVTDVNIKYTVEDNKSTAYLTGNLNLIVGDNSFEIKVVSESGVSKEYTLVITRAEFVDAEDDLIIITVKKSQEKNLQQEILEKAKNENKKIQYNVVDDNDQSKILYSFFINGANLITSDYDFKTEISFTSNNKSKIDRLVNNEKYINLNFAHYGKTPENMLIKVFVGETYDDGTKLDLYLYNKNLELILESLMVEDGYVEFTLEHFSEYILIDSNIKFNQKNHFIIYIIIFSVFILGTILFLIYRKQKNQKIDNNQNNSLSMHENETILNSTNIMENSQPMPEGRKIQDISDKHDEQTDIL